MKYNYLIIILLIFHFTVKASEKDSIIVTHIANCGFLIELDSTKIIIDGLFKEGFDFYATPDSTTLDLIVNGLEPFDKVDYLFVTHKHSDHFDNKLVTDFMINNSKSKLICPYQVILELRKQPKHFEDIKSRVINCTPDTFISNKIQLDELEILACRLSHSNEKNKNIENIAYRISYNNKTIFHTGDADPNQVDKYQGTLPSDKEIDIAFINGKFGNYKNFSLTNEFIGADKNISMHFPKDFFKMEHKMIMDVSVDFIEPITFKESMERKILHVKE